MGGGFGRPALAAATVPTEFRGGLIYVEAAIGGGRTGVFLLDTGAATTVLDARYAATANLKLGDAVHLLGGGGETEAHQAEDVRLKLAGEPDLLIDPTVTDLGRIGRAMGVSLDGILGDDVLRRFVVTLDYRNQQVRFAAPGETLAPADAFPMRLVSTPFVKAEAHDRGTSVSAEFQIDTGSNTAVEFWQPFADKAFPQAWKTPGSGLGVAGRTRSERGRIGDLVVAGRTIAAPEANFADQTRPDDASQAYGGVIGGPAWAGLVLTLDFPRQKVWVR